MPFEFANWRLMTADGLVVRGPVLLYSIHYVGRATGKYADVYEGMNATGGNEFCELWGTKETDNQKLFNPPAFMDRGIYIDAGGDLTQALFVYRTIDDSPFKLERGG